MILDWEHWDTVAILATSVVAALATGFAFIKTRYHLHQSRRQQQVLSAVSHVNNNFLLYKDPRRRFGELLEVLKSLTGSPMGLISERMEHEDGTPYMRCYAITNLAWDEASRRLYEDNIDQGIDFNNLDNLFGQALTTGNVIIANHDTLKLRPGKAPKGHPEIESFIGIPLKFRGEVLGMFALANSPQEYSQEFVDWLSPLTNTITGILYAFRIERAQREASRRMLEALKETEEANQVKSDFLATMSHEIRTPLNAVVGMLDSLASTTALTPLQKDYIQTADNAADTLLSLINDVLDFSKIEAGQLTLEQKPVNLCEQVQMVMTLAASTPAAEGIDLYIDADPETPLEVIGDPVRLRQIMHNLIGNAVKFTHEGHVTASLAPIKDASNRQTGIRLSIEDTGIGIAASNQAIIFNAFRQADHSSTREYQGTGLGLAITRHLVDAMDGEVEVASHLGRGSRFTLNLPLQAHGSATLDSGLEALPLGQCKVLCVTNSHQLYENLYRLLSQHTECVDCHFKPLIEDDSAGSYNLLLVDDRRYPLDTQSLRTWIQQQSGQGEVIALSNRDLSELFIPVSVQIPHPVSALELINALTALYRPELMPPPSLPKAEPAAPVTPITDGLNILIAEDNPINHKMMQILMDRAGADYRICADGRQVLSALEEDPDYDVILMDVHMPHLDGFDTTRAIRRLDAPLNQIPIIAVTADALAGDREKCLEAGMNDYLAKPIRLTELQRVIARTLASRFIQEDMNNGVEPELTVVDFDPDRLTTDLGGVENAIVLINEFANSLHSELALIKQSMEQEDSDQASALAHRLKGSARSLQCQKLAHQLEVLEQQTRSAHFDPARLTLQQLEQDLPALELRLLHFCSQNLNRDF
ncbi:response regulator [Marinobacterium sp. AK62]|uniref:histidine kinase n=1 Tax=Marinobacterium alkalitolerans TaxID=1542925 RepID=A0ABS3ZCW1_9GAMM|nr:ATP-binding protein [Marinobacterium alkalitolerans]MBP0049538.1 response regulator [Marinobacterium alkalitolerans]